VCGVAQKLHEVFASVWVDVFLCDITGGTEGYFVNKYSRLSHSVVGKMTELLAGQTGNHALMPGSEK